MEKDLRMHLLAAFFALAFFCQPATVRAADAKPKEPLKPRVGLASAPVPPLPNSSIGWPKTWASISAKGSMSN
jgi:hypothetical protein